MQAGITDTVLDRYYALVDRAVRDPDAFEELIGVFALDAVVRMDAELMRGRDAIVAHYRGLTTSVAEGQTYWSTSTLDDGRLKGEWVFAARMVDGRLVTSSGIEHATLDSDGLIVALYNEYIRPPA